MEQNTKELLELAAKACGYEVLGYDPVGLMVPNAEFECGYDYWRPHLDSGDGASMENILTLDVIWRNSGQTVEVSGIVPGTESMLIPPRVSATERLWKHNGDKGSARRWAAFRAAADIGRQMA